MRDHIRYKEEHSDLESKDHDADKDPDREATPVAATMDHPLDQDKNKPAPWYLEDPDAARRKEARQEAEQAIRAARVQRPGPPAPCKHERDQEEAMRARLVPFLSRYRS